MEARRTIASATSGAGLADILERILDKGVVIVGDIKVNLVQVELLTIQVRLVVCSLDKAREVGIDWWMHDRNLCSRATPQVEAGQQADLLERVLRLEHTMATDRVGAPLSRHQGNA